MTEQYWIREDGEVIAVGDMNEHHAKNALRKVIKFGNYTDLTRTASNCSDKLERIKEKK